LNKAQILEAAIKYDVSDVKQFAQKQITSIQFFPLVSNCTYAVKIWAGDPTQEAAVSQDVSNVKIGEWNTVTLETPFVVDVEKALYIGYRANTQEGFPLGCDYGPGITGKSDLLRFGASEITGGFSDLFTLSKGSLNVNWNIKAQVEPVDGVTLPLATAFNIYRDEVKIAQVSSTVYSDTIIEDGAYAYAVSAIYFDEIETGKTETVEVLIDRNRIERSAVVIEKVTSINCVFCPGAALALEDMVEADMKVAPIAYHGNGLGADKYNNAAATARESYYGATSYPTTIFNGIVKKTGGNATESLFESYKPIYEEQIAVKTPFALAVDTTEMTINEFDVKVAVEKVGLYEDASLVLHTVVVENDINQNWQNQSKLEFVERAMFPSAQGTEIELVDGKATIDVPVTINYAWEPENLMMVVFIQNKETKEILNGEYVGLPKWNAVKEAVAQVKASVYPNPAINTITVEANNITGISVYNVTGTLIKTINANVNNKMVVDIADLESGLYLIETNTTEGTATHRIVKQ
jgi:hypothetical protein